MRWFLLSVLSAGGAIIVALCIVALFVRHRTQRFHRVDLRVPTAAPLTWLADPRAPARLHRRLAKVGRAADAVAADHRVTKRLRRTPEQPPLVGVALDLQRQAVRLDHELTRIALLPSVARRAPLGHLATAVADLERAAARLVALSADVRTPPVLATEATDLIDVAGQIERLAEAHRVLLQLDASAGLVPAPAPMPSPVAPSAPLTAQR